MTDLDCLGLMHEWSLWDPRYGQHVRMTFTVEARYVDHLLKIRDMAIWEEVSDILFSLPADIKKGEVSLYGKHMWMKP